MRNIDIFYAVYTTWLPAVVFLPGGGSIQQGSVRLDHRDVGVSSNADAQTDKNQV